MEHNGKITTLGDNDEEHYQLQIHLPLGRLIHFVGPNDFIPGLLGLFYTGLRIRFFSW
jgi:hypothetical protein